MVNSPHYESDPSEKWKEEQGRFILKPRGFDILWGNHEQYWHVPPPNIDGPARLKYVYSLDVHASKDIDPKKSYEIGFNVSITEEWGRMGCDPVFIMVKRGENGNLLARRVILDYHNLHEQFDIPGNFVIKFAKGDSSQPKIHIHLYDHWSNHRKYGLVVHHAFVKEVRTGDMSFQVREFNRERNC